jgi:prophage tail gpP-like protein
MILKNDVFADFLILCIYVQGREHTKWIRFKIRSSLIKMSSLVSTVKQYGRLMGEECVFIT